MQRLILVLALLTFGPENIAAEDVPAQTIAASLAGDWQGHLEYRDYRTDKRVRIPHARRVLAAPDASYLLSALEFTDPGYKVYNAEVLTFAGDQVKIAFVGSGSIDLDAVTMERFEETSDGWAATFTGSGEDAGQPAAIQFAWRLAGDELSIEKRVKTTGEADFSFRNGVVLQRQ